MVGFRNGVNVIMLLLNAESGLFFRALSNRTLSLKSEKCTGGKLPKERITILFCVNMFGEKEKLLVIGKAARTRTFKNTAVAPFPVDWRSNKKAWMTGEIVTEWLKGLNKKIMLQKTKIISFLGNNTPFSSRYHICLSIAIPGHYSKL